MALIGNHYSLLMSVLLLLATHSDIMFGLDSSKSSNYTSYLHNLFKEPGENQNDYYFITGGNLVQTTSVPKNNSKVCIIVESSKSNYYPGYRYKIVNVTAVWDWTHVKELWVLSDFSTNEEAYFYRTNFLSDVTPQWGNLLPLEKLHIKTAINTRHSDQNLNVIHNLIKQAPKLKVLDLKRLSCFQDMKSLKEMVHIFPRSNLRALSLSNVMTTESSYDFLVLNVTDIFQVLQYTQIEYLDLSFNYFTMVTGSFVGIFPKLRILDLSFNHFEYPDHDGLSTVSLDIFVFHPNIEIIILDGQIEDNFASKKYILSRSKRSLTKSSAIDYCLNLHDLSEVELKNTTNERYCKVFNCIQNVFNGVDSDSMYTPCSDIPTVEEVLSWKDTSGKCHANLRIPLAPNLREISMNFLNKLDKVGITDSDITYCLQADTLQKVSMRNSETFFITRNWNFFFSGKVTLNGLLNLNNLDMSQNKFTFYLENKLFQTLIGLESLNISQNVLKFLNNNTITRFFTKLKSLDISKCNMSFIPENKFKGMTNLQQIYLSDNNLKSFNIDLKENIKLRFIDIRNNQIETFTINVILHLKSKIWNPRLVIDLRDNSLLCNCNTDSVNTIELLMSADRYNITFWGRSEYICSETDGFKLIQTIDITKLKLNCKYPNFYIILSTTVSNIIIILLITVILLVYKFRLRIKTWLYRCKWYFARQKSRSSNFKYDAFLSYCHKDWKWVRDLMNQLEDKYGFGICIYERDFCGGGFIADEIASGIQNSRAIIVVLSEYSLTSRWCGHELHIAHQQSVEMGKKLIIVKLFQICDVAEYDISPFVRQILDSRIYIEWPEPARKEDTYITQKDQRILEQKIELFWVKLSDVLYSNLGQVSTKSTFLQSMRSFFKSRQNAVENLQMNQGNELQHTGLEATALCLPCDKWLCCNQTGVQSRIDGNGDDEDMDGVVYSRL